MKNITGSVFIIIVLFFSGGISAENVYEKKNADGTVEFSDEDSPGAEQIDVEPNVIDVTLPPADTPLNQPGVVTQPPEYSEQQGGVYEYGVINNEGTNLRRDLRRERDGGPLPDDHVIHRRGPTGEKSLNEERRVVDQPVRTR